jgi:hypothetical protein
MDFNAGFAACSHLIDRQKELAKMLQALYDAPERDSRYDELMSLIAAHATVCIKFVSLRALLLEHFSATNPAFR